MKHFLSLMRGWPVAIWVLLLLLGPAARAQAPAWQSAVAVGQNPTGNRNPVWATASDASGNVYIAGSFQGTVAFGSIVLSSTTSTAPDAYVAKWSPATNSFVWVQQAGSAEADEARALAVSGNAVYVTGTFYGATASFGNLALPNSAPGNADVFVAKLVDAGTTASFAWVQGVGGSASEQVGGLAAAGATVYVTGNFTSPTASFGNLALSTVGGGTTLFVAKLLDAGSSASFVWTQRAGSSGSSFTPNTFAYSLALNGSNLYIAGYFDGATIDFGGTTLANANGVGGNSDIFVAKLADAGSTGSFVWALRAGGVGTAYFGEGAYALAVQGNALYITGGFDSATATFGGITLTNAGTTRDIFVAKLTDAGSTGSFVWAQRAGSTADEVGTGLALSGSSVLVGGSYRSGATFGPNTYYSAGSSDAFVAKLTDLGAASTFAWVLSAGGTGSDVIYPLLVQGSRIWAGGFFGSPSISFGSLLLPASNNSLTGFLASLTDPTLTATTPAQSALPFTLAPNPARTATTVQLPAGLAAATATLTLRDALGRTLRTETVPLPAAGLRHELKAAGLSAGFYCLQVRAGSAIGTQRLVVE